VNTPSYLHTIEGRLRIKSAILKGEPEKACEVERQLKSREGVTDVTVNPITGSVLVLYDPRCLSQSVILDTLKALGCFETARGIPIGTHELHSVRSEFGHDVLRTVVLSTLEFTVQRLVYALI
jgi:copper chaperone CopZ